MIKNNKRGFNLIEIAIVLAVIGLVIGGIYVAASAVTENNRKQNTQKQLLTIVSNIRALYATSSVFAAPATNDAVTGKQIFPADMNFTTGASAKNVYGGDTTIAAVNAGSQFSVAFDAISQGACIDLLSKAFGGSTSIAQIGLVSASGTSGTDLTGGGTTGVAPTSAAAACTSGGNANTATFTFNLRG